MKHHAHSKITIQFTKDSAKCFVSAARERCGGCLIDRPVRIKAHKLWPMHSIFRRHKQVLQRQHRCGQNNTVNNDIIVPWSTHSIFRTHKQVWQHQHRCVQNNTVNNDIIVPWSTHSIFRTHKQVWQHQHRRGGQNNTVNNQKLFRNKLDVRASVLCLRGTYTTAPTPGRQRHTQEQLRRLP
jgi:hypothetical protein